MGTILNRKDAYDLLCAHNQEEFHRKHALTVEGVMRFFAERYGHDPDFWGMAGLLHDLDFEEYPDRHCIQVQAMLREREVDEALIHAVASHGYGLTVDIEPTHFMEKVLFATDELTGLIGACTRLRPSQSTLDMELKSLKKKYSTPAFAAGCSRQVMAQGADMLGWPLDRLLTETLEAMQAVERAQAQA